MKKYLCICNNFLTAKNNLQRTIQKIIREQDRKVIQADDIIKYRKYLTKKINEANAANSRCKAEQFYFWNPGQDNDIKVQIHFAPMIMLCFEERQENK